MISFEGCDGSGKSSQIKLLESHLAAKGRAYVSTREPGGTSLGKMIRRLLDEDLKDEIASQTEPFLYLADRAQHVLEVIQPALRNRTLVLCDRFTDSTLAYQGYGRGVDLSLLRRMNQLASCGIEPDLTLLLDCPVEMALSRTARRRVDPVPSGRTERFEGEDLQFHERVRRGFLELARAEPERIVVLEASAPTLEVHEEIKKIVNLRLND